MQIAQLTSPRSWLHRLNSLLTFLRAVRSRGLSLVRLSRLKIDGSQSKTAPALRIARYNLVLMDHDGQVV